MEYLPHGLTLEVSSGAFPLSTDSVVLANFVKLPKNARVLDLGSGCGTLGLMLCAGDPHCTVTGLEIDANTHAAALENISRNGLQSRLSSICTDLRRLPGEFPGESFTTCVSNPPYFSGGPASKNTPIARRDDCCSPDNLFSAAGAALKYGGDFYLVHKPEKLAQLIVCGAAHKLEAKNLRLIRHRESGPIAMILLRFRKGGKPGLVMDERSLYTSSGEETPFFREIYHIE